MPQPITDPILAAIAAHRSAFAAYVAAEADAPLGTALAEGDCEREALERLAATKPTTIAGAAAAMRYLGPTLMSTAG